MKKFPILLIAFIVTSCAVKFPDPKIYIGMDVKEFVLSIPQRNLDLYSTSSKGTIYKVYYGKSEFPNQKWSWPDYKFYYFDINGKLIQADKGVSQPEKYQIEHIKH